MSGLTVNIKKKKSIHFRYITLQTVLLHLVRVKTLTVKKTKNRKKSANVYLLYVQ